MRALSCNNLAKLCFTLENRETLTVPFLGVWGARSFPKQVHDHSKNNTRLWPV